MPLLADHFHHSNSKWCGPKGLHADIGSLKRFNIHRNLLAKKFLLESARR